MIWVGLALAASVDLEAAVARAEVVGLDAVEARLAVESAEATRRLRGLAGLPDLGLDASLSAGIGSGWSSPWVASARLGSTTHLYAGGALSAARRVAEAQLRAARALEEQTRQDLVYALADALFDLDAARARLRAAEAALLAEDALLTQIGARLEAGAALRSDQLQQAAAVAKQRSTVIEARRDLRLAELVLLEMLRLDEADFVAPGPADSSLGVEEALARRQDLAAQRASVEAAERAVEVAAADGRPAVDLDLAAGSSWSGEGSPLDAASASASVGVSVPIFARGTVAEAVAQARIDVSAERATLADLEAAVRADVRGARLRRDAARALAEAAGARVEAARAAEVVVAERHRAGAAKLSELLLARAELVDAEAAAAVAAVEARRTGWALRWAVGEI